jgi:hypothetical protein
MMAAYQAGAKFIKFSTTHTMARIMEPYNDQLFTFTSFE